MFTNRPDPLVARRQKFFTSGLALRLLFALAIGFLVVLAFFATNALSH